LAKRGSLPQAKKQAVLKKVISACQKVSEMRHATRAADEYLSVHLFFSFLKFENLRVSSIVQRV
jgi:hypothetical protein